jgi:hypothetical protein
MGADRTRSVTAPKGEKLTLGDLRSFVGEMDHAGAADTTPVRGRVTFGGWLKEIKATAVRFGDPEGDR